MKVNDRVVVYLNVNFRKKRKLVLVGEGLITEIIKGSGRIKIAPVKMRECFDTFKIDFDDGGRCYIPDNIPYIIEKVEEL